MSDELIKSLNQRISELETKNTQLNVALRVERKDAKAVKEQLDDVLAKVDEEFGAFDTEKEELSTKLAEYEAKANAAPDEKDATIKELQGKILERDHRDAWKTAIGPELSDKADISDVWSKAQYKPEGEPPDAAKITEWVGKAKEAAPYLFRTPDPAGKAGAPPLNGASQGRREPLKVADTASRGARDTASSTVRISKSVMSTPGWMTKDKAAAAAFKSGDYVVTDD